MEMLFALFGGLAMFLYGMDRMSRALQRAAGDAMKRLLARLTATPLLGVLTGLAVTAVLQSSSAATVMVIGFAPPLYPAYHSDQMTGKEGAGSWQFRKIKKASEAAGCMVKKVHYFTGISDLSYCGTCGDMDFSGYAGETPLWGGGYQVDFNEIGKLNIPPHGSVGKRHTQENGEGKSEEPACGAAGDPAYVDRRPSLKE